MKKTHLLIGSLMLVAAALILLTMPKYVGFNVVTAEGGTITPIDIVHKTQTIRWQGYYGLELFLEGFSSPQTATATPGGLDQKNLVFECLEPDILHEVYAARVSPSTLSFSTAVPATIEQINAFIQINPNATDSANNTFTYRDSFLVSGVNITDVPTTYTRQSGVVNSTTFKTGVLNISGQLVFVAQKTSSVQIDFKNEQSNYQIIVGVPNSTFLYYFSADPDDECPEGLGVGLKGDGFIIGYVLNNITLLPLANVTVSGGGNSTTTDNSGFYNLTAPAGFYHVVGTKTGFNTYFELANVTVLRTIEKNFTLVPSSNSADGNGTVRGRINDSATGALLGGVVVTVGPDSNSSDGSGNYSINVQIGDYVLVATKPGYLSYLANVTVNLSTETTHDILLRQANGTLSGKVFDGLTGLGLSAATVSIGSVSTSTDGSGNYVLSIGAGTHFAIASKTGYTTDAEQVSILSGQASYANFSIEKQSGSLVGTVYDNATNTTLANATVYFSDQILKSNSSGDYNATANIGNHLFWVVKEGYQPLTGNVSIELDITTRQDVFLTPLNGTVGGNVTDAQTNELLANVTISIAGLVHNTNATGQYNLSVPSGRHMLVAVKSGYASHIANVTINPGKHILRNISMQTAPSADEVLGNGTLIIEVKEAGKNVTLANVSVSVAGQTNLTNSSGRVSFIVPATINTVVAIKSGYATSVTSAQINISKTTFHEIEMASSRGYVNGTVKDSGGNAIPNVNITVGSSTNISTSTGNYLLTVDAGTQGFVATKLLYLPHAARLVVNGSNTTTYNFLMETVPVAGAAAGGAGGAGGAGAATAAGGAGGSGVGIGPGIYTQPPKKVEKDYDLSATKILRSLRQGTFATAPVTIKNFKTTTLVASLTVDGEITEIISLDKTAISIDPNGAEDFTATLLATAKPGLYRGKIDLTGDISDSIPVEVLIYGEDKLPIETLQLDLELFDKEVHSGDLLRYRITMQNLLKEEEYTVSLSYTLVNMETNEIMELGNEDIIIGSSASLLKNVVVPKTEIGDYFLVVDASFLGFTSNAKESFTVTEPIYKYAVFGIVPLWMLGLLLSLVSTGTFSVAVYRKQAAKKKRYVLKVDYKALPNDGPRSAYVGRIAETMHRVHFDLDLFQVHTLIAGSSGSGKSFAANVLVEEALLKNAAVIVFDPTAQWTGFLRKNVDKRIESLYAQFGMKKEDAKAFSGNVRQIINKREQIDIKKYMKPGEITVFVVNKLEPQDIDVLAANVIRQVFRSNLPESKELRLIILFDEVHRLLPKFGGTGEGFTQIERAAREFRKWGVGLILISQVLTDFAAEIKANINTQIQMRTRHENDLNTIKETFGEETLRSLNKASIGTGLVQNSNYNRGKPFFVSFRPILHSVQRLTDEELENYNKYNDLIDDIEYQIEQLKGLNRDIFDLTLELKLAKDKLKGGNFNMVDIYLESLRPRVESQWQKIGQKPKKYVRTLVGEATTEAAAMQEAPKDNAAKEREPGEQAKPPATPSSPVAPPKAAPQPAPSSQTSPQSPSTAATKGNPATMQLIAALQAKMQAGSLEDAKKIYGVLQQSYKNLTPAEKALVYKAATELSQRLKGNG